MAKPAQSAADKAAEGKKEPKEKEPKEKAVKPPKEKKLTRQERIRQATEGKEFEYVELRTAPFTCICAGKGTKAHVVRDLATGEELLVGTSCLKHTGVSLPRKPRGRKPAADEAEGEGEGSGEGAEAEGEGSSEQSGDPLADIVGSEGEGEGEE